jgi:hypothetical protein
MMQAAASASEAWSAELAPSPETRFAAVRDASAAGPSAVAEVWPSHAAIKPEHANAMKTAAPTQWIIPIVLMKNTQQYPSRHWQSSTLQANPLCTPPIAATRLLNFSQ